jgi:exopolyphosphatase/guanosine-5'-triphosphate,3'-diphosphate pyrophosphatase
LTDFWGADADPTAQGRIKGASPVAVLDIGSNSVRLVVYERLARALTPLYNEKSACALGRGIAASGRLADANVERALTAIKRFALVSRLMRVGQVHVLATSAVRDASNRDAFVSAVEEIMQAPVRVLSGPEEAHFAALGVVAGIPGFSGIVGDLGGGSLELSAMTGIDESEGETHPLGVIRLQDDTNGDPTKAAKLVRAHLKDSLLAQGHQSGIFCAIGGTWRSLAKQHQVLRDYPLQMVQHYNVPAADLLSLCDEIVAAIGAGKSMPGADAVSSSRRDLVPYGAAVMGELLRQGAFETVVFSALGVREGYLYGQLEGPERAVDPLLQGAEELSVLRSRSPQHGEDLISFTGLFLAVAGITETDEERRLRLVACHLADIGWRGHPDYRGAQSVDMVAYGSLHGIDHAGRAFLAEVMAVRYAGLKHKSVKADVLSLLSPDETARAKMIGAAMRVAYPMSAAMPGILPRVRFSVDDSLLRLHLPLDLAFLDGEHLRGRMEQFASVTRFKTIEVVTG